MSQENVETVRAMFEDFLAGATEYDADGVLTRLPGEEVWDADIVLDISVAPMPDASVVFKGIEACRGFWREWLAAWDALKWEYDLVDAGDHVVALINNQRMRGRSTGIEMPIGGDLPCPDVQRGAARPLEDLSHPRGGPRSRRAVGVGRSRQPLRLRDTARAMSQENVKIVKRAFEVWNAGDMDAFRDLFDPDVIWRQLEGWPEPGPEVGREAVMHQLGQQRETWDADALELTSDFIDAADRIVVRFIWRGAGHGPEANLEATGVFTVRKGRVFYVEFFWDHAEALETLGLSE